MDAVEARLAAIDLLDRVLAGEVGKAGELARAWPRAEEDVLMRRARQEAMHYLMVGGALERAIVELLRRFLLEGGSAAALEQAYDEVIASRLPRTSSPEPRCR